MKTVVRICNHYEDSGEDMDNEGEDDHYEDSGEEDMDKEGEDDHYEDSGENMDNEGEDDHYEDSGEDIWTMTWQWTISSKWDTRSALIGSKVCSNERAALVW